MLHHNLSSFTFSGSAFSTLKNPQTPSNCIRTFTSRVENLNRNSHFDMMHVFNRNKKLLIVEEIPRNIKEYNTKCMFTYIFEEKEDSIRSGLFNFLLFREYILLNPSF